MSTPPITTPALGADGESCPNCGELLRPDQRYCLNCGRRRAPSRLPFAEIVSPYGSGPVSGAPRYPLPLPPAERSPLVALAVLVALLLALGIGVLLGRSARAPETVVRAPVVNVTSAPAGGAGTTATTTAAEPFVSDWPAGQAGWTVQLRTLPATTTTADVTKAKQDDTTTGASAVGALRSDDFPTLPAGQIVIYAGMFNTRPAAAKTLPALRKLFPGAKLVHVAGTAAATGSTSSGSSSSGSGTTSAPKTKPKSSVSPQEYEKRSKKLPDKVQSQGTAPPKDNKAPGGGSGGGTVIG